MRFFLIDRVTELVVGEKISGVKCVTLSDEILHDHFPDFPVMPGVLIVEACAQLAGFLLEMTLNEVDVASPTRAVLTQVNDARFYATAGPGDRIEIDVTLGAQLEGAAKVSAEARVGETRVARASLTFMMKPIASERVHAQRRYLYSLWTRELTLSRSLP